VFVTKECSCHARVPPVAAGGETERRETDIQRFRCTACGNLTRFDVTVTRRTRGFYHFTVGGDLDVEDEEVLEERVEDVICRWCAAEGSAIERLPRAEVEPGAS
jgi:hypothetical protein